MSQSKGRLRTTVLGRAVLALLQEEARIERCQVDDDTPSVPDPFDSTLSAQSRRTPVEVN